MGPLAAPRSRHALTRPCARAHGAFFAAPLVRPIVAPLAAARRHSPGAEKLLITSVNHPGLRPIVRLAHRKARDEAGRFYVEGVRFVSEAAEAGACIEKLVVCPPMLRSPRGRKLAARLPARGAALLEVTEAVLQRLSLAGDPQGIAAVLRQRWTPLERGARAGRTCWLAIETVSAPGNFGTLLRTCEAVGGAGAILLGPTADPYDPAVVRATMGAHFSLTFTRAGHAELAAWKRRTGTLVVGTSPDATRDYRAVDYRQPVVLMLGCEQHGMTAQQAALCDEVVRIPMVGRGDSLNLGVAGSLMLYEVFNQRR